MPFAVGRPSRAEVCGVQISRIRIENFRCIKFLDMPLDDEQVFIGQNNSGKTAILDAIRIALTRRWGQRGTGFTEYDVHLDNDQDDPKQSPGIAIEVTVAEKVQGEWPEEVPQALSHIVQSDPSTGRMYVTLRVTYRWDESSVMFQTEWQFLNAARQPLVGSSARRINLERFWQFIPMFYLGALRDADDEFSSRSQFWGKLLKAIVVPANVEDQIQKVLDSLNTDILNADPRLEDIAGILSGVTEVAARDRRGAVELRLVPLKSWDLLSKAQIVLRNEPKWPWLPLQNHGQGVQSLSVIFLFEAFVSFLLADTYADGTSPILALEEPETHLHPQAARTLWQHVDELPGQKFISTHSPYFVQYVPFRHVRVVRLTARGTEVHWLRSSFARYVPNAAGLDQAVQESDGLLQYDKALEQLTGNGVIDEGTYRKLLRCFADQRDVHQTLRELRDESSTYISDSELRSLETYARRIRGEIFFASRWLIVEGQAEYLILHGLARALGYDLDEHGVAVIDSMNNGNPAIFASLARALAIPWMAVFDGDDAGRSYVESIRGRGFRPEIVDEKCRLLPAGNLEEQLLEDGLEEELRWALGEVGIPHSDDIDGATLRKRLEGNKAGYAAVLGLRLREDVELAHRMPKAFCDTVERLKGLE